MPARNAIKTYSPHTSHHIYNRGVEKRAIFVDAQDYDRFLETIKQALSPSILIPGRYQVLNFHGQIALHGYCLRNNHLHMLITQLEERAMESFMRSLMNSYIQYFNKRHQRVGSLFQDAYKGRQVMHDADFVGTLRYIHENAVEARKDPVWQERYSSADFYERGTFPDWLTLPPLEIRSLRNGVSVITAV